MASLYLVDSSIYVYRAWHSLPDTLLNADGMSNNAFIGFSNFVYHFMHDVKPRQMVFAFDEKLKQSARRQIYPDYKAHRTAAPEALLRQFAWCREWLQLLGLPVVSSGLHEADDLIGSLAEIHRTEHRSIVILTADKDLAQLIRDRDVWWSFATGQQFGYRALIKKFGVKPEQIADQLALAGDKVDNIPGIPGVGMTIAGRLLTKFETLQNLRKNLDQVGLMKFRGSKKIMQLLKQHEAILDVSSRLTPINCQVDSMLEVDLTMCGVDKPGLTELMRFHNMEQSWQQKWMQIIDSRAL
jgi:5'-3' exonuclease